MALACNNPKGKGEWEMEKVKGLFKRYATMFIALMCVLGMGTPVLAEDPTEGPISSSTTGSFTVTEFDSEQDVTVNAYQIITVNINDSAAQPEYPMYMWATEIQSWIRANYNTYIGEDGRVLDVFDSMEAADKTVFLEELALAIKSDGDNKINLEPTKTVTATKVSASFTEMPMGEYLVTASGGVKIYSPTTVKLVPVYDADNQVWKLGDPVIGVNDDANMKSQEPSIFKAVKTPEDKTVSIGDTVTYTLTVTIPDYPTSATAASLSVSDILGSGLTFNGNNNVTVTVGDNKISAGAETYSFTAPNQLNGKAFEIVFDPIFVLSNGGKTMTIEYNATVKETVSNSENVLKNTASITYSSNPYAQDLKTKYSAQNVYTYKTVIHKVNSAGKPLPEAEFTLKNEQKEMYFVSLAENPSTYIYNSSVTGQTSGYTNTLKTGSDGNLTIIGLDEGTYTLTETKAPNGYVVPQGSITFTLVKGKDASSLGTVTVTPNGEAKLYVPSTAGDGNNGYSTSGDTLTINVQNISKDDADFTLPSTGGMGTLIFTVGGLFVMAGAVVLAVYMYKKRNA